jgi:hypothetical protein
VCVSRDECPEEDHQLYERYRKLQDEVQATLADREKFCAECHASYYAACQSANVGQLTKPLMTDMTRHFLQRLNCDDDPRFVNKIHAVLDSRFPVEDQAIVEAAFRDFIAEILQQIDRDTAGKLRKLETKHPGVKNAFAQPEDATSEQAPPPDAPRAQGYNRMQDRNYQLEQEELRHKEFKRQQEEQRLRAEQVKLEEQRRQQQPSPLNTHDLNVTYDAFDAQRNVIPVRNRPDKLDRIQLQPQQPLSASNLQQLQTSLAQQQQQQRFVQQQQQAPAYLNASVRDNEMLSRARPPPPSPDPMTTSPLLSYTSDTPQQQRQSSYQAVVPPPTVVQPAPAPTQTAMYNSEFSPQEVQKMMRRITSADGGLKVQVYNQDLQLTPKRLAVNMQQGKIGIFDVVEAEGAGYISATFDLPDLKCITQGISQSIMEHPPPPEVALGFRFSTESADAKNRSQDKFLCFVFDTPVNCRLAAEAFSQLCGVPVAPAV